MELSSRDPMIALVYPGKIEDTCVDNATAVAIDILSCTM
jgi:hypothetical protein